VKRNSVLIAAVSSSGAAKRT